jgi:hypothetical protein
VNSKRVPKRANSHAALLAECMDFYFVEQTVCEEVDSKITFCLQKSRGGKGLKFENVHNLGAQGCTNFTIWVCELLCNFVIFVQQIHNIFFSFLISSNNSQNIYSFYFNNIYIIINPTRFDTFVSSSGSSKVVFH